MTHTKGKWFFNFDENQLETEDGKVITVVEEHHGSMGDITLITSAPDLLLGYKELLGRVNTMAKAMRSNDLGEWVDEWLNDGILDGDTIAKAEGEKK